MSLLLLFPEQPEIPSSVSKVFILEHLDDNALWFDYTRLDNIYVSQTGDETITGAKTFTGDNVHAGDETFEGTTTFAGDTVFKVYERHIQIPAFLSGTPANQPVAVTVGTATGLQFSSAADKTVGIQWEIPDDWDGTDIYIEIDWLPDSGAIDYTGGDDVIKWDVSYRSIAEGETITNGTAVDLSLTTSEDFAQYQTEHSRFTLDFDNTDQPLTKQDHMYFTITRDVSVANDFAGTVVITAFEIIYNSIALPTSN